MCSQTESHAEFPRQTWCLSFSTGRTVSRVLEGEALGAADIRLWVVPEQSCWPLDGAPERRGDIAMARISRGAACARCRGLLNATPL